MTPNLLALTRSPLFWLTTSGAVILVILLIVNLTSGKKKTAVAVPPKPNGAPPVTPPSTPSTNTSPPVTTAPPVKPPELKPVKPATGEIDVFTRKIQNARPYIQNYLLDQEEELYKDIPEYRKIRCVDGIVVLPEGTIETTPSTSKFLSNYRSSPQYQSLTPDQKEYVERIYGAGEARDFTFKASYTWQITQNGQDIWKGYVIPYHVYWMDMFANRIPLIDIGTPSGYYGGQKNKREVQRYYCEAIMDALTCQLKEGVIYPNQGGIYQARQMAAGLSYTNSAGDGLGGGGTERETVYRDAFARLLPEGYTEPTQIPPAALEIIARERAQKEAFAKLQQTRDEARRHHVRTDLLELLSNPNASSSALELRKRLLALDVSGVDTERRSGDQITVYTDADRQPYSSYNRGIFLKNSDQYPRTSTAVNFIYQPQLEADGIYNAIFAPWPLVWYNPAYSTIIRFAALNRAWGKLFDNREFFQYSGQQVSYLWERRTDPQGNNWLRVAGFDKTKPQSPGRSLKAYWQLSGYSLGGGFLDDYGASLWNEAYLLGKLGQWKYASTTNDQQTKLVEADLKTFYKAHQTDYVALRGSLNAPVPVVPDDRAQQSQPSIEETLSRKPKRAALKGVRTVKEAQDKAIQLTKEQAAASAQAAEEAKAMAAQAVEKARLAQIEADNDAGNKIKAQQAKQALAEATRATEQAKREKDNQNTIAALYNSTLLSGAAVGLDAIIRWGLVENAAYQLGSTGYTAFTGSEAFGPGGATAENIKRVVDQQWVEREAQYAADQAAYAEDIAEISKSIINSLTKSLILFVPTWGPEYGDLSQDEMG